MKFNTTDIEGLLLVEPNHFVDARGSFVKTFHEDIFKAQGLETDLKESFYSESLKGVIRGMHFQLPPHDHAKLVFCTAGEVLDVALDLRKNSKTYGQCQSFSLSEGNKHMLYIPRGMAHGFCSISDKATLFYFTTSMHAAAHDTGVRYDSFGFNWPVDAPVLSDRDKSFPALGEFDSPF